MCQVLENTTAQTLSLPPKACNLGGNILRETKKWKKIYNPDQSSHKISSIWPYDFLIFSQQKRIISSRFSFKFYAAYLPKLWLPLVESYQGKNYKLILVYDTLYTYSQKIRIFFGGTGVWIQGFRLAKQVFYHLSHTSCPRLRVLWNFLTMGKWDKDTSYISYPVFFSLECIFCHSTDVHIYFFGVTHKG
jgi:hypothetical protein